MVLSQRVLLSWVLSNGSYPSGKIVKILSIFIVFREWNEEMMVLATVIHTNDATMCVKLLSCEKFFSQ